MDGEAKAKSKAEAPLPNPPLAFGKGRGKINGTAWSGDFIDSSKRMTSPLPCA
ncbi:hypothetical protein D3C71_2205290 [compost metagenome]